MNNLARRLYALERELNGPAAIKSEHEWLAGFEKFHMKGAFKTEPDFGTALDGGLGNSRPRAKLVVKKKSKPKGRRAKSGPAKAPNIVCV